MTRISYKFSFALTALISVLSTTTIHAASDSLQAIAKRIAPVAKVNVATTAPPQPEQTKKTQPIKHTNEPTKQVEVTNNGEKIYTAHCKVCHESGAAGAPKITDANAWETRSKQGLATLVEHAIKGYKLMPPKGACVKCTDEDIKDAVSYMLKQVSS